jgi:shikimate dehydrogenase
VKVFCILSDERAFRSKSPPMFSEVLKKVGINGTYVPFMVKPDQVGWALQSLRVLNIAGANVTVPYKETVIPYLDALSEGAQIIGAINTITRDGEVLKGYNTNSGGFMDTLNAADINIAGKSALVFGAGGAARAVVFMLKWLNADSIFVTGRSEDKIRQLVDRIGGEAIPFDSLSDQPVPANILVNATSVSSVHESPELASLVEGLQVQDCKVVIDLNYGRSQNFWQDMALSRDIKFMDGHLPLAYQARRSFELWTGVKVEPREFLKALGID